MGCILLIAFPDPDKMQVQMQTTDDTSRDGVSYCSYVILIVFLECSQDKHV